MISLISLDESNLWMFSLLRYTKDGSQSSESLDWMIAEAYVVPGSMVFGICAGGGAVGLAVVRWNENGKYHEIARLVIDDKCRGKGYGSAAVRAVVDILRQDERSHEVVIAYDRDNHAAGAAYRKAGFEPCWMQGHNDSLRTWVRGQFQVLRMKFREMDVTSIHKTVHPQRVVSLPVVVETIAPHWPLSRNASDVSWERWYDFDDWDWSLEKRAIKPAQVWSGAKKIHFTVTLMPGENHGEDTPVLIWFILAGPLLECESRIIQLSSGENVIELPFNADVWRWGEGRSQEDRWGAWAFEKIGPVQQIRFVVSGTGRKDRGKVRVESINVE